MPGALGVNLCFSYTKVWIDGIVMRNLIPLLLVCDRC